MQPREKERERERESEGDGGGGREGKRKGSPVYKYYILYVFPSISTECKYYNWR